MAITVVSEPLNSPPRNRVTVAVAPGAEMQSASVWRIVNGVRTLLRTQPSAGFDTRTVDDYEAPYGVPVTYGWTSDYTTSVATVWDEVWASTAAWTASVGSWTVVGGQVRNGAAGQSLLARSFVGGKYRFTFSGLTHSYPSPGEFALDFRDGLGTVLALFIPPTGSIRIGRRGIGGTLVTTYAALNTAMPFTVSFNEASITIIGTGANVTVPIGTLPTSLQLEMVLANVAGAVRVGEIVMSSFPVPLTIAETSAVATLTASRMWLVHPSKPVLSVPLSATDTSFATFTSIEDVENESNATVHSILGSSLPVTTTNGNRAGDATSLGVRTYTFAAEASVVALLQDETPILVQIPAGWLTGFNCVFYQVGKLVRSKTQPGVRYPFRDILLPLTQTQSPLVNVSDTGWSWAALAAEFPTWDAIPVAFASWADLAANIRIP